MKKIISFKEYNKKHIDYVPDEPIHFKHIKSSDKDYVPDEPIHFKHVGRSNDKSSDIKEEVKNEWFQKNDNEHLGNSSKSISEHLQTHQKIKPTKEQSEHIKSYTNNSRHLNRMLIRKHINNDNIDNIINNDVFEKNKEKIKHLDKATNHHIGHELHVYSGIGFDPSKHISKEKPIMHLPAYTSTTHDKNISHSFAFNSPVIEHQKNTLHILHIHLKPRNKGIHINHLSEHSGEHETILPRNTKLKVNPIPEKHYIHGMEHHIWHATVHSQE
jgi:hypothetical protein